jgi:hypothetical protein
VLEADSQYNKAMLAADFQYNKAVLEADVQYNKAGALPSLIVTRTADGYG